jgi:hypothetical protein
VFEGALAGLVLPEAEFDDDVSLMAFTPPAAAAVAEDLRAAPVRGRSAVTTAPGLLPFSPATASLERLDLRVPGIRPVFVARLKHALHERLLPSTPYDLVVDAGFEGVIDHVTSWADLEAASKQELTITIGR